MTGGDIATGGDTPTAWEKAFILDFFPDGLVDKSRARWFGKKLSRHRRDYARKN
jgi:hypothetical protein